MMKARNIFTRIIHVPDFGIKGNTPEKVPNIINNVPIPKAKTKSSDAPIMGLWDTAT